MTKEDIKCYRSNYDKDGWLEYNEGKKDWILLPAGILDAVKCLCDEVERLNRRNKWE